MKKFGLALASIVLGLWASLALAHHSAAQFDFAKTASLDGVVKEIRVINPHMVLTLAVDNADGKRDIVFEGHSANNFYRSGWRNGMIKSGDKVKVNFAPRRDGKDGGFVVGFTTADGKEIGFKMPGIVAPELPPEATAPLAPVAPAPKSQ